MELPDKKDLAECTRMAGEMIAWLDEKTWTDKDKVAVSAGVLPLLMVRISKDKAEFERIKGYFLGLIDKSGDLTWKTLRGSPGDVA